MVASKISSIFLGKKMLNFNGIINTKIKALEFNILIVEYYKKFVLDNSLKVNNIIKDLNFQLNEILTIREGIRNMSELDDLLNKLRYKK